MYLWATLAARDLGFINNREATKRIDTTLTSVERLERHEPSGQFYNWYDPVTLEKLTVWPESAQQPRLSIPVERRQRLAGVGPVDGRECDAQVP